MLRKKKGDKGKIKFEECCKSLNIPPLRYVYSKIERVEIRMQPNERRKRIIELLSFRRHETMGNLANEFGVSRGTIIRDITILQADYPIIPKRGYEGGVSLPDGYYVNAKHLSPKQVDAIRKCIRTVNPELIPVLESVLQDFAW